MSVCDKCGEEVSHKDDATHLEAIAFGPPSGVFFSVPRHIMCSPSRAQYIVHDEFPIVVENRDSFNKELQPTNMRLKNEKIWTDAWLQLKEEGELI